MKICVRCRVENAKGQKYCVSCGSELIGDLERFLIEYHLEEHLDLFLRNDLHSLAQLCQLKDTDLDDLGLPLGDKIKLRKALPSAISSESEIGASSEREDEITITPIQNLMPLPLGIPEHQPLDSLGGEKNKWRQIILGSFGAALALICLAGVFSAFPMTQQKRKAKQVDSEKMAKLATEEAEAEAKTKAAKETAARAEIERLESLRRAQDSENQARLSREKADAEEKARQALRAAAQAEKEKLEALQKTEEQQRTTFIQSISSAGQMKQIGEQSPRKPADEYQETINFIRVDGGKLPSLSKIGSTNIAGFLISSTELTWSEWRRVRDWASLHGYDIYGAGAGSGPNHPVRNISWFEAIKWCNARSEMSGLTPFYEVGGDVYRSGETTPELNRLANGYRLPTEAEWEWAARGGNRSVGYRYSGSNNPDEVAWYWDNTLGADVDIYQGRGTWPVARKKPNELGIYDMSGNVWEWCWDQVHGSYRAIRGGRWSFPAERCAVDYRENYGVPTGHADHYGLRIVKNMGPGDLESGNQMEKTAIAFMKAVESKNPGSIVELLADPIDYYNMGLISKNKALEDIKNDWRRYSEYRSTVSNFRQTDATSCQYTYDYSLYEGIKKREGKLLITMRISRENPQKIESIKSRVLSVN